MTADTARFNLDIYKAGEVLPDLWLRMTSRPR